MKLRKIAQHWMAGVACLGLSAGAEAGWYAGACGCGGTCGRAQQADLGQEIELGRQQNIRWPGQHLCPDRLHTQAPFDVMVQNGWRRQNLLGAHHFNEDCSKLSQAGEIRVRWIMTQTPPQYRQLFVEQSIDPAVTQTRLAVTQEFAAKVSLDGGAPNVTQSHLVSEGRPAATVDLVNTRFRENMPVPALPASTQEGTEQ